MKKYSVKFNFRDIDIEAGISPDKYNKEFDTRDELKIYLEELCCGDEISSVLGKLMEDKRVVIWEILEKCPCCGLPKVDKK